MPRARRRIRVRGIVQGVGFRPFVWRLAGKLSLSGWVLNDGEGVLTEVEGEPGILGDFEKRLLADAPPLAAVEEVTGEDVPVSGEVGFKIIESRGGSAETLVSPDVALCAACLREMRDTKDRRYRYPFINCTDCGPRYTIIEALPYDRPLTTMAEFEMCPDCLKEYEDPADRRFHAQPNACPVCGPHVWLTDASGKEVESDDPVSDAADLLSSGKIVAIKGLGGFHLAVDAANEAAVARLRRLKHREEKPLALMVKDIDTAKRLVETTPDVEEVLHSPAAPIVLAERLPNAPAVEAAAPGQKRLGVMLPYTPLHHRLLSEGPPVLIMTSGNLSEEPIAHVNDEAIKRLSGIADAFLLHNRKIYIRVDDSVVAVDRDGARRTTRRSRGYAPRPVKLTGDFPEVLALGPQLKNTITYIRGERAFMSHHIGDLENVAAMGSLRQAVRHLGGLYGFRPQALACDLHPYYASTAEAERMSEELDIPVFRIQHHHAHATAALAEMKVEGPALAIVWDGTGYGDDGAIWGAEWMIATQAAYRRVAHLGYTPIVGGDAAIRNPARTAFLHVLKHLGEKEATAVTDMVGLSAFEADGLRSAASSELAASVGSMGRLFDAVSALCGIRSRASYEGQAAIELEAAMDLAEEGSYNLTIDSDDLPWRIDETGLLADVLADLKKGVTAGVVSTRFHQALVKLAVEISVALREAIPQDEWPETPEGRGLVILSGGTFQNAFLVEHVKAALKAAGFDVFVPAEIPVNDGGISLGQAVVASRKLRE